MAYYPIFVDMTDKRVLVVGGGHVAEEKVAGLLRADAAGRITVVAPKLRPSLQRLLAEGKIDLIQRDYREGDMEGFDFVMVATDDGRVNAEIAAEGRRRRIWVNAADDPKNCDFILPAVVRQGQIVVAASTGGASPALARRLREELTDFLSEDFAALADLLGEVRTELRRKGVTPDAETWQRAIDGQLRALLAQRRWGQAKARLVRALGVADVIPVGIEYEDERAPKVEAAPPP
ncbi:MAG TPA: bifunctional precorrin-2 dehydrogenase/sirohydrochlorin ferrochelatase [Dehalococcoidia bacterium]|nr:bifunctional precorrin-2 dehydrogenase/sirohydrochlorin ferrochelatase [Dehalococcoidia bacterium]